MAANNRITNKVVIDLISDSDSNSSYEDSEDSYNSAFEIHNSSQPSRRSSEVVDLVEPNDTNDFSIWNTLLEVVESGCNNPAHPPSRKEKPESTNSNRKKLKTNKKSGSPPPKRQKVEGGDKHSTPKTSPLNHIFSKLSTLVKKEFLIDTVGFGEADMPPEIVEIANPFLKDATPEPIASVVSATISPVKTERTPSTTSQNEGGNDDDEEDVIEYIGGNMTVASDMPHARDSCLRFRFDPSNMTSSMRTCSQCYCYVCEVRTGECPEWGRHCLATYKSAAWKREKTLRQSRVLKLLPLARQRDFFANYRYLLDANGGGGTGGESDFGVEQDAVRFVTSLQSRSGLKGAPASSSGGGGGGYHGRISACLDEVRRRIQPKRAYAALASGPAAGGQSSPLEVCTEAAILFVSALKMNIAASGGLGISSMDTFTEILVDILVAPAATPELRAVLQAEVHALKCATLISIVDALVPIMSNNGWLLSSGKGTQSGKQQQLPAELDRLGDGNLFAVVTSLLRAGYTSPSLVPVTLKIKSVGLRLKIVMDLVASYVPPTETVTGGDFSGSDTRSASTMFYVDAALELLRRVSPSEWNTIVATGRSLDLDELRANVRGQVCLLILLLQPGVVGAEHMQMLCTRALLTTQFSVISPTLVPSTPQLDEIVGALKPIIVVLDTDPMSPLTGTSGGDGALDLRSASPRQLALLALALTYKLLARYLCVVSLSQAISEGPGSKESGGALPLPRIQRPLADDILKQILGTGKDDQTCLLMTLLLRLAGGSIDNTTTTAAAATNAQARRLFVTSAVDLCCYLSRELLRQMEKDRQESIAAVLPLLPPAVIRRWLLPAEGTDETGLYPTFSDRIEAPNGGRGTEARGKAGVVAVLDEEVQCLPLDVAAVVCPILSSVWLSREVPLNDPFTVETDSCDVGYEVKAGLAAGTPTGSSSSPAPRPPSRYRFTLALPLAVLWKSVQFYLSKERGDPLPLLPLWLQSVHAIFERAEVREQATAATCLRRECPDLWVHHVIQFSLREFAPLSVSPSYSGWYAFFRKAVRIVTQAEREWSFSRPSTSGSGGTGAGASEKVASGQRITQFWNRILESLAKMCAGGRCSAVFVLLHDEVHLAALLSKPQRQLEFVSELRHLTAEDLVDSDTSRIVAEGIATILRSSPMTAEMAKGFIDLGKATVKTPVFDTLARHHPGVLHNIALATLSSEIVLTTRMLFQICEFDDKPSTSKSVCSSSSASSLPSQTTSADSKTGFKLEEAPLCYGEGSRREEYERLWKDLRQQVDNVISMSIQAASGHGSGTAPVTASWNTEAKGLKGPRVYGRVSTPDDVIVCAALLGLDERVEQLHNLHLKQDLFRGYPDLGRGSDDLTPSQAAVITILLAASSIKSLVRYLTVFGDWIRDISLRDRVLRDDLSESSHLHLVYDKFFFHNIVSAPHPPISVIELCIYHRPRLALFQLLLSLPLSEEKTVAIQRLATWIRPAHRIGCFSIPEFIEIAYMLLPRQEQHLVMHGLILESAAAPTDVVDKILDLATNSPEYRPELCHWLVAWCFQSNTVSAGVRSVLLSKLDKLKTNIAQRIPSQFQGLEQRGSEAPTRILPLNLSTLVLTLLMAPALDTYQAIFRFEEALPLREKLLDMSFDVRNPAAGLRIYMHEREFYRLFRFLSSCLEVADIPAVTSCLQTLAAVMDLRTLQPSTYLTPLASASPQSAMDQLGTSVFVELVSRPDSLLRQIAPFLLQMDGLLSQKAEPLGNLGLSSSPPSSLDEYRATVSLSESGLSLAVRALRQKILSAVFQDELVAKYVACCSFSGLSMENIKALVLSVTSKAVKMFGTNALSIALLGDFLSKAVVVPATVTQKINLFRELIRTSRDSEILLLLQVDVTYFQQLAGEALMHVLPNTASSSSKSASSVPALSAWLYSQLEIPSTALQSLSAVVADCGSDAALALENPIMNCFSSLTDSGGINAILCDWAWKDLVSTVTAACPELSYIKGLFAIKSSLEVAPYRMAAISALNRGRIKVWIRIVVLILTDYLNVLDDSPESLLKRLVCVLLDDGETTSVIRIDYQAATDLVSKLYEKRPRQVLGELSKMAGSHHVFGKFLASNTALLEGMSSGMSVNDILQEHFEMAGLWGAAMQAAPDIFSELMLDAITRATDYIDKERVSASNRTSYAAFLATMKALFTSTPALISRWHNIITFVRRRLSRKKAVLSEIKLL